MPLTPISAPSKHWTFTSDAFVLCSIGKKDSNEFAVMVDTFKPLMVTEEALKIDDGKYWNSWAE